jgi:hypothetical protein
MGFSESDLRQLQENQRAAAEAGIASKPNPAVDAVYSKFQRDRSEAELERDCTNILIQDGWRALKTDPVSRRAWGKGFGEKGMADHLYIRYESDPGQRRRGSAEIMWIEWKRGNEESKPHQDSWQQREHERGALVLAANRDFPATVDGFMAWYKASGLKRSPCH